MNLKNKIMVIMVCAILFSGVCLCFGAGVSGVNAQVSSSSSSQSSVATRSSVSNSLLPSTGKSVESTQPQDWDQIMSGITEKSNKDEFTFSENPDNGIIANASSKLLWIGVAMLALSVLGVWYLVYSNFFSKNCARMKNKRRRINAAAASVAPAAYPSSVNNVSVTRRSPAPKKQPAKHLKSRGQNANYGDGYGFSKTKKNTHSPSSKRISMDDYGINIPSAASSKRRSVKPPTPSPNEIYSDSSFSTRELKKDAFWNDFFSKQ